MLESISTQARNTYPRILETIAMIESTSARIRNTYI